MDDAAFASIYAVDSTKDHSILLRSRSMGQQRLDDQFYKTNLQPSNGRGPAMMGGPGERFMNAYRTDHAMYHKSNTEAQTDVFFPLYDRERTYTDSTHPTVCREPAEPHDRQPQTSTYQTQRQPTQRSTVEPETDVARICYQVDEQPPQARRRFESFQVPLAQRVVTTSYSGSQDMTVVELPQKYRRDESFRISTFSGSQDMTVVEPPQKYRRDELFRMSTSERHPEQQQRHAVIRNEIDSQGHGLISNLPVVVVSASDDSAPLIVSDRRGGCSSDNSAPLIVGDRRGGFSSDNSAPLIVGDRRGGSSDNSAPLIIGDRRGGCSSDDTALVTGDTTHTYEKLCRSEGEPVEPSLMCSESNLHNSILYLNQVHLFISFKVTHRSSFNIYKSFINI